MTRPIMTRAEAIAAGLTQYFTGKPCKHGHISERLVANKVCMACAKLHKTAYREKHPDRVSARYAAWRAGHREELATYLHEYRTARAEELKAKYHEYRARNLQTIQARERAYNKRHTEARKASARAWGKANPDKKAAHRRNRKAAQKAAEGRHTAEDVQRILSAQKGKCACCRRTVGDDYHVDHIQPLSKGGSNWPSNLQILCPFCNISKKDRDPVEFMQSRGMLL